MLSFGKAANLSLLFESILFETLSNSLWGSDVSVFSEFINKLCFLCLYRLHYTFSLCRYIHFLVFSFARYKKYTIWRASFSKFLDVLPAFTCASAIATLWSIRLGVNIYETFTIKWCMFSLRCNCRIIIKKNY